MFDLDVYVFGALRSGASGFLLKDTPPEDLLASIRVIAGREALLAPSVTHRLISEFVRQPDVVPPDAARLVSLTVREHEVLIAIADDNSSLELAEELHMSVAAAKTHVSHILAKLGARDRAQLVAIVFQSGLVLP